MENVGEMTLKACCYCGDIQEMPADLLWKECETCRRNGFCYRYMTRKELLAAANEDHRVGFVATARRKRRIAAKLQRAIDERE